MSFHKSVFVIERYFLKWRLELLSLLGWFQMLPIEKFLLCQRKLLYTRWEEKSRYDHIEEYVPKQERENYNWSFRVMTISIIIFMNTYAYVRVCIKLDKYWNKSILWFRDGIHICSNHYAGGWWAYVLRKLATYTLQPHPVYSK